MLSVSEGRDDVHIEFVNKCSFDVNFAWYETKCSGSTPNVLYLNERVTSGQSTSRVASEAPFAGGRIYAWAAEDQSPGEGMTQETFKTYMALSKDQQCGSEYTKYMLGAPPFMSWAAFAELTFDTKPSAIINDADVSMVDNFYLPMSWDWLYGDNTGLNVECYNTSLVAFPDESSCNANGGAWKPIPTTKTYAGSPKGYCVSPNTLCQNPSSNPVCSANSSEFQSLISQLTHVYTDLQSDATSGGEKAFTWQDDNRDYFPGQLWTCMKFQNAAKFQMAEMCAAINRGLCDLSSLGTLSADDFATWTKDSCGTKQNQQPASTWFVDGNVRNPYAYWLRRTLQGTTYTFSQDEGLHGGNSNCNNINPPTSRAPESSRVTVCPNGPSPTPLPVTGKFLGVASANSP